MSSQSDQPTSADYGGSALESATAALTQYEPDAPAVRGEIALALMAAVGAIAIGAVGLLGNPSIATTLQVAGAVFGLSAAVFATHSTFATTRQRKLAARAEELARRRLEADEERHRVLRIEAARLTVAMQEFDVAVDSGELYRAGPAAARLYDEAANTARELASSGDLPAAEALVVSARALWPVASRYIVGEEPRADGD